MSRWPAPTRACPARSPTSSAAGRSTTSRPCPTSWPRRWSATPAPRRRWRSPCTTWRPSGPGSPSSPFLGGPAGEQRVPTDVTLSAGEPDELGAGAAARTGDGFGVLKLKVGTDAATDVARVQAVRDAAPQARIRVDANQGWTPDEAIAVIRALEDAGLDIEFVEQPVHRDDLAGMARVTEAVRHAGDGRRVGVRAAAAAGGHRAARGGHGQRQAHQVRRSPRRPRPARARPRGRAWARSSAR